MYVVEKSPTLEKVALRKKEEHKAYLDRETQ